ncbi:glyoxylase-like metal-dependent hydrolase (beta-lactamase superfamily II) [Paenibacillus taihuensis]|uniref:Glyoxylase-like metal-dependent hydrolase (Beta-lactamase superfamily II) n=1 Tax=Paenibacillus taihuensis TaxID=1156355 RepID=A0A3D9RIW6_9BACL|nr:MBL fold metallo-hydrolase [Paenibacillus taihuensis]REE78916.1 glyoxylase-like metal-dependent hydrolase (beta-lactamase superfamily II) [Paenibacillus taihuensis]
MLKRLSEHLFQHEDTCLVYVIVNGTEAVLIDFGSGAVLDELASIGVERVTDVLMTHHHRDQGQGLARANAAGIRIWVPHHEQDLFANIDLHWYGREIYNNYDVRQDRFSLLTPVGIAGTLKDYARYDFGGRSYSIVPTPGHTIGSISVVTELDNRKAAFTGDLIAGPGKVWSMSATQWTYNGSDGVISTVLSVSDLRELELDVLLPSHGVVMEEPAAAIDPLIDRLRSLLQLRGNDGLLELCREPEYKKITPHLLWNVRSFANSYTLLSKSGKALMIDYGYPSFHQTFYAGTDRSSRRPNLRQIGYLKKWYNVSSIDVVIPTHYHDDHVAGLNLLRDVEGTQTWVAENFADLLEQPARYDVPCIWYDPIPVDRRLPLGEPIQWEEYTFRLYEQPGHTLYAVAISFEVDGKHVVAIGDQQDSNGNLYNYVYKNKFRSHDYVLSAELYQRLKPDLIISGHWDPLELTDAYLEKLARDGETLKQLHDELLPLEEIDMGAEGFCAWIKPYQIELSAGATAEITVEVLNPLPVAERVAVRLVAAAEGLAIEAPEQAVELAAGEAGELRFYLTAEASMRGVKRARIAADVTVGARRLGQQADALVTVI